MCRNVHMHVKARGHRSILHVFLCHYALYLTLLVITIVCGGECVCMIHVCGHICATSGYREQKKTLLTLVLRIKGRLSGLRSPLSHLPEFSLSLNLELTDLARMVAWPVNPKNPPVSTTPSPLLGLQVKHCHTKLCFFKI